MAKKQNKSAGKGIRIVRRIGVVFVFALARRTVRLTVLGILLVVLIWLLYVNVWQPLRQEVPLPAGVTEIVSLINTESFEEIHQKKNERTELRPFDFSPFSIYFLQPTKPVDES